MTGKHNFAAKFKKAKKPLIVLGTTALANSDAAKIATQLAAQASSSPDWKVVNVLHTNASQVAALDLGFSSAGINPNAKFVYLLGADETVTAKGAFVVYQGHHGDKGAMAADVVFPGAAYTEKDGTYVNTEGRAQSTQRAVSAPGQARDDWKILGVS